MIDDLHSLNNQRGQMEGESGVARIIIDELHFSDIQEDQMAGESGVTRSIIDEPHSSDIQEDKLAGESVLLQVSLMDIIYGISKDIKSKVKVVIIEVSSMIFIL